MKRFIAAFVIALAARGAPPAAAAEALGRLFYTPAQRVQLDAARSQRSRSALTTEAEPPAPLPEHVTYQGVVRRSDGRTTVWINDRAIQDGRAPEGVAVTSRVRPDGSVSLGVGQSERSVTLKVGQSVEVVSGTIGEPYHRARSAPKPPPEPAASATKPAPASPQVGAPVPATPRKDANDDGPDAR